MAEFDGEIISIDLGIQINNRTFVLAKLNQTMDKNTFKQEINDYTARGGKLAFTFGDISLPVIYHEKLNMLGVKMPAHEVFVPVDYTQDLDDNLDVLMNKLLDKYPQLTD